MEAFTQSIHQQAQDLGSAPTTVLPPMVAWQIRVPQLILLATSVCREVAVVTPSQLDSIQ